ncbi:MAG: YqaA family protein [Gammaproteobacteria bacterium]
MRLFAPLYDRVMQWAAHRHAPGYLAVLSFAESSFFPIPPDVMLAPMTVAKPARGLYFALLTTVASVLGGVFGYLLGYLALDFVKPMIEGTAYWPKYLQAREWFNEWGVWVVFVAGFSPIPYKIFTITAGALSLALLPFIAASLVGRGARFFLVALTLMWLGPQLEPMVRKYIEWFGWLTVVLLCAAVVWLQLRH